MKKGLLFIAISVFLLISCSKQENTIAELSTQQFKITLDGKGEITAFYDLITDTNYLVKDSSTYLMSIRVNDEVKLPHSALINDNILTLKFDTDIEANIEIEEKLTHINFELISISNQEVIDLIIWGPYHTTIDKIIGETVGVVRGEEYAIGIQSLNIKTLGGYPWNESDRMPAFDIFKEEDLNNMHPSSDKSVLYRVEAAKPTIAGSSLQAYCRNRKEERIIQDFSHEKIIAPIHEDGGIINSKIALFGCTVEETLETLGKIELSEGLPHPMIDGVWSKMSPTANAAYLITSFTENDVEEAIELTKKAGLKYLYHYGKTFESWGHFDLYKGEFPNGIEGLKRCVEKAESQGVKIGTHCLSNFITTDDPYVTPIPDKRLAKVGSSIITNDIDAVTTKITIQSPDYFNQMENNNLKTVMIEDELIRYGKVSEEAPWRLLDCQRGAFNTTASKHQSKTDVHKLLDHAYKVFLTNADLTIKMSKTLAELYSQTGLRQISFDGLEGNRSTGLGTYGESLMPYTWYNSLSAELKDHLIIDASRTTHFFWHIYTRMNWGEPWYAGFRESQTEYRFNNQAYFKRNFMPGMLGWFKMTPELSIEDIEWMLAKSAGYDAGYALVADTERVEKNNNADKIFELIGDWEKLRLSNSFTDVQKEQMRDNAREFSIKRRSDKEWHWYETHSTLFTHEKKIRQPGEPLYSIFEFNNPAKAQTIAFTIIPEECDINELTIEINNYKKISLPINIKKGQKLKYISGNKIGLYDSYWNLVQDFAVNPDDLKVNEGENEIAFNCIFREATKKATVKVELRTNSIGETVKLDE